jgi:hypothetical protein
MRWTIRIEPFFWWWIRYLRRSFQLLREQGNLFISNQLWNFQNFPIPIKLSMKAAVIMEWNSITFWRADINRWNDGRNQLCNSWMDINQHPHCELKSASTIWARRLSIEKSKKKKKKLSSVSEQNVDSTRSKWFEITTVFRNENWCSGSSVRNWAPFFKSVCSK